MYVELHCHSSYSLREGASTPRQLVERARELGYQALALTDHNALYGAMEFATAAAAANIRPIIGAEITLTGEYHLTLLAETSTGYANLCRLLSHAYLDHSKDAPEVTFDVLADHAEGLIALSGCKRGEVPALIQSGARRRAAAAARRYIEWFGRDGFFIELQQNLAFGDKARNAALVELAEQLGVGYVATNNVHYHVRERHRLHDVLVAIHHQTTLDASHRLRRENSEYYLKSAAEMRELFAHYPRAIWNAGVIAERCTFNLIRDLGYQFPHYPVPEGETADTFLARICQEAFGRKYGQSDPETQENARQRLTEELRLIRKHGLAGFFLTYRDILKLAGTIAAELRGRDPNLPPDERPVGRGRGSSVSSIVCYLIGLSHIDPVKTELFLGRFLNDELASVPDIDLDFPRDIRERLLERVYKEFGEERAALVCTFATYRLRSAIRDVGKALGLPAVEIDKLAKLSERWGSGSLGEEMARLPEFRERLNAPLWRDLVDLVQQILRLPRHIGQHVGGVILSARPLQELVPLEPARMAGRVVCQWDKDSVDDARFVKIDFLALGMLSLVDECLEIIESRHGQRPDLGRIPHDDPQVFDRICAGDTMGMFQIESRAQIQSLPHTQPRTIDDLAVQVAIIRPGPIMAGSFHPYMEHRRRLAEGEKVDVEYLHPCLESALRETLGVILYQDQVLQVAMAAAGYSAGEADRLRRDMGKRHGAEIMETHWPRFLAGAKERGIDDGTARAIFERLLGFSGYGFPKSHAVAFALLAYESAWLRTNFPTEYYCALFNNQPMGFYSVEVLTGDARRHGVKVVEPDLNLSLAKCRVEADQVIRLGLGCVQGIGEETAENIVRKREQGGPFRSLFDCARRTGLRREALENLITAGAADSFGLTRRELLWQLGLLYWPVGQQPPLDVPTEQDMVALPSISAWEQLVGEYKVLNLSPNHHPLAIMRSRLPRGLATSATLERMADGAAVRLGGMVVCRQRPWTAKGVVFLLLEDEFGLANVVVYPTLFERQRNLIRLEPLLLVYGHLQRRGGTINVVARHFQSLRRPRDEVASVSHDFY